MSRHQYQFTDKPVVVFCFYSRSMDSIGQGFIEAFLLTSVFHEGLSFIVVGHNPTCVSVLALAAGGSYGGTVSSI